LWRRQSVINFDYGVDNGDLADMHCMPRLGEDNLMMTFGGNGGGKLTKFHKYVLSTALTLKARLVVVDTAADVFGGNENDRNHVRQFISRALVRAGWPGHAQGGCRSDRTVGSDRDGLPLQQVGEFKVMAG
jgi:hypothetical protein